MNALLPNAVEKCSGYTEDVAEQKPQNSLAYLDRAHQTVGRGSYALCVVCKL